MTKQVYNIFPTTIYVNQIENHKEYKSRFYKLYSKYDYEQTSLRDNEEWFNTTSENFSKPYIHLEEDLCELFEQIIDNVKIYVQDVLKYQDIFNFIITKTWLSRSRDSHENVKWHSHSTSHISFSYYLNTPPNSHLLKFANPSNYNGLFAGLNTSQTRDGVEERNELIISNFMNNKIDKVPEEFKKLADDFSKNGFKESKVPNAEITISPPFLAFVFT